MLESNIYFATNTYCYGGFYSGDTKNKFNTTYGEKTFFRQVMDYDALKKLRQRMGGTLNSNYYVATLDQIKVLDPKFHSVMIASQKPDPQILAEIEAMDQEYGYPKENHFYSLLVERRIVSGANDDYISFISGWTATCSERSDSNLTAWTT